MIYSICTICGKNRNEGNHKKCSRIKQQQYAPGTALRAAQEAELKGKRESRVYLPLDITSKPKSGVFSRLIRGDS